MNKINVTVSPQTGLADEFVNIQLTNLEPATRYYLWLSVIDEADTLFSSYACYISDDNNSIDVKRSTSVIGSYIGVFPSGLFSTLKPEKKFRRLKRRDVTTPYCFLLSVWTLKVPHQHSAVQFVSSTTLRHLTKLITSQQGESNQAIKYLKEAVSLDGEVHFTLKYMTLIERHFLSVGVTRELIFHNRLRGVLFIPYGPGVYPAILDFPDGGGGLNEDRAALLASRGFITFTLAYFRYDNLPKTTALLEFDYIEEAADFLFSQPKTNRSTGGVGAIGLSKGGEYLIGAACHTKKISALCSMNGNIAASGGMTCHRKLGIFYPSLPIDPTKIVYYNDETVNIRDVFSIPCNPTLQNTVYKAQITEKFTHSNNDTMSEVASPMISKHSIKRLNRLPTSLLHEPDGSVDTTVAPSFEKILQSMYPLENIRASCLFIAGANDQNWRSSVYASEAYRRVKAAQTMDSISDDSSNCKLIIYPGTGHYIEPPYVPFQYASYHRLVDAIVVWGGNPFENQIAQEDAWQKIQIFFKTSLEKKKLHAKL